MQNIKIYTHVNKCIFAIQYDNPALIVAHTRRWDFKLAYSITHADKLKMTIDTYDCITRSYYIVNAVICITRHVSTSWRMRSAYMFIVATGREKLPPVISGVRVTRSLVLCVRFVDHHLSFCTFSFGHCVVCSSSIYGFWLPLWYLQTLLKIVVECKIVKVTKKSDITVVEWKRFIAR